MLSKCSQSAGRALNLLLSVLRLLSECQVVPHSFMRLRVTDLRFEWQRYVADGVSGDEEL